METKKKNCLIYSRRRIDTTKDSFDEQLDICRKYCLENDLSIRGEFSDYGRFQEYSEIDSLFEFIIANPDINLILSATEDRIIYSTNPTNLYKRINSLLELERCVELICVTENSRPIPLSQIQRSLFSAINSYEKTVSMEKAYHGLVDNALSGGWIGVLPTGYKRIAVRNYDIVHTDYMKFICEAFKMKLSKSADKDIVEYLEGNGISIIQDTLAKMFRNIFYTGHIRTKLTRGALVKGRHEGIITLEEFEQLQKSNRRRVL